MKLFKRINAGDLQLADNRKRVGKMLFYTTLVFFVICAYKITKITITGKIGGISLKQQTQELYKGRRVIKAKRGLIYDRNGKPIVENISSYSVKAILSKSFVKGEKKFYAQEKDFYKLASILDKCCGIKKENAIKIMEKGVKKNLYQVEFGTKGRGLTLNDRQKIQQKMQEQELEGLFFDEHPGRHYPNGEFASHLIGYTKSDEKKEENKIFGVFGLENAYENVLAGKDGEAIYEKNLTGNMVPGTQIVKKKSINGKDLYTTLDLRLQSRLEILMEKAQKEQRPENMTAILMSAKTGEVLAMSQRPSFNPDTKKGLANKSMNWKNIPFQDNYEPGSTMKIITTAVAQNEGKFHPNETFIAGARTIYDKLIGDWDYNDQRVGIHQKTFLQGLASSSNVAMTYLEDKIGDKLFNLYQQRFGFGQFLDNGIGQEAYGNLPKIENPLDMTMSAFGQSIDVTGMQMMRAISAVSNNGAMLEPHVVSKIVSPNTKAERKVAKEVVAYPITKETAQKTRDYLTQVVKDHEYGLGYSKVLEKELYQVPGYNISPKTGTAQVALPNGTGYVANHYLHSIAIIAPTEDPQFILYVTIKFPGYSDDVEMLSKITNPLLKQALESGTKEPKEEKKRATAKVSVPYYKGKSPQDAENEARHDVLQPVLVGDGTVVKEQSIAAKTKVQPNTKIIFRANGKMQMPDIIGWRKKDIDTLAKLMNIDVKYSGKGVVAIAQSIGSYLDIQEGEQVKVKMGKLE
ncbi:MAG: PASTA domain-containing protein [Streptococcaceae bacterium]|jgi:penicillin-binding protein 2X|nr:PASTA domain-containing protein [Streptococcaceae bacterium]